MYKARACTYVRIKLVKLMIFSKQLRINNYFLLETMHAPSPSFHFTGYIHYA